MDGKYLATNIGPLKTIGEGKVFNAITDLLNSDRFEGVELAAYSIRESESRVVGIDCLFKKYSHHTERDILSFRTFDFYRRTGNVNDYLKQTAEHGIGFTDYELNKFMELRDFYLQNKEVPEEV
jgi:hypothetical protein